MTFRKLHSDHLLQLVEGKTNHKVGMWLENMLKFFKN